MNFSFRKILVAAFLIVLPVAGFLAARSAASWRPQKLLTLPSISLPVISPDERFVAGVSPDGQVWVRALPGGQEVLRRKFHRPVSSLMWSPDGQLLAIAWIKSKPSSPGIKNSDRRFSVPLWNIKGRFHEFEMYPGKWIFDTETHFRFSADGQTLWMASTDNLRAWDVRSGRFKWQWLNREGRSSSLSYFSALSKDGRLNFRSDSSGYTVWDTQTKKYLLRARLPFLYDEDLKFSSDSSFATYYADTPSGNFTYVIDTRTAQVLWKGRGGFEIAVFGDKAIEIKRNTFDICDARNGKLLYTLPAFPRTVPVSFASNRWLYTINDKKELFRQRAR